MNVPQTTEARQSQQPGRARSMTLTAFGIASVVAGIVLAAQNFGSQPQPAVSASRPRVPEKVSAEQLLASIPDLPADSETGRMMKKLRARLSQKPDDASAWCELGDVLAQEQRSTTSAPFHQHAESAYRRALDTAPGKADAMTGLAWVFGFRHLFLESVEWARRALEADPANAVAHGITGDALVEQGDYDGAFEHYQSMSDLRPDLSSWSRGAYLLWLTGSKNRAVALMGQAVRSGGPFAENTAWCRARLAVMLVDDGALLPAAQALEPALKSSPDDTRVLLAAGRLACAQGDLDAASRHYQHLVERGPQIEALAALGDISVSQGHRDTAEGFYSRIDALHTSNVANGIHDHISMARFLADHNLRLDEALKLATQHSGTRNVLEADVLAWVYFKNGDMPHAIESMKLALSQNTPDPEMQFHAGMIAARAGDHHSAITHLQNALSMNPRFHLLLADVARSTLEEITADDHVRAPLVELYPGK